MKSLTPPTTPSHPMDTTPWWDNPLWGMPLISEEMNKGPATGHAVYGKGAEAGIDKKLNAKAQTHTTEAGAGPCARLSAPWKRWRDAGDAMIDTDGERCVPAFYERLPIIEAIWLSIHLLIARLSITSSSGPNCWTTRSSNRSRWSRLQSLRRSAD